MSTSSAEPPLPDGAGRPRRTSVELVAVRRRDLVPSSAAALEHVKHGAKNDPRYPSPRELRSVISFAIDLVAHWALAFLIAFPVSRLGIGSESFAPVLLVLAALVLFVLVSFVDRVLVQSVFGATVGKALTGLRMIRDDTGGPGTLWLFLRNWLLSILVVVGAALGP
ncbi:RDD family protein [Actinophytocola sp.]|uniref:RDD family protein n=1 Tax=Actinophytocola sp. TaxID=1872138 RepID=UPI002ED5A620